MYYFYNINIFEVFKINSSTPFQAFQTLELNT